MERKKPMKKNKLILAMAAMGLSMLGWMPGHSEVAGAQSSSLIVSRAHVVTVRIDRTGRGVIQVDKDTQNAPSSVPSTWMRHWAITMDDPGAEGILSSATAAYLSGREVTIVGYPSDSPDVCNVYSVCIPRAQFITLMD